MDRPRPQIVPVDPTAPSAEALDAAVRVLAGGGVVTLPTETFYGLAADAGNPSAVDRVRRAKRLEPDAALLLLAADLEQVSSLCSPVPPALTALAGRFWPGPLTVVLSMNAQAGRPVCGRQGTIAVRVPGLRLARELAERLGRPLTGTSANRHGGPPSRTAAEALASIGGSVEMILDGGPTAGGAPSTIVDLTVEPPRLLREGLLPAVSIRRFVELAPLRL